MKEYHLHKSPLPEGAEQYIISSVVRDDVNKTVSVEDIFVVTIIDKKEVKSRIDIQKLVQEIVKTPGGNIPIENHDKLYQMLDPLVPTSEQLQNHIEVYRNSFNSEESVVKDYMLATELAAACHPIDFDSVIEELLNKKH